MGFALPAAVAASIVFPDRRAVAVTGDGGFLMACMELSTAMENKTNPVTVIFNDSMYGMIWQLQMRRYGGRSRERDVRIHTPNFAKLAESFGARGIRVEDPSDLSWAYEEAFNSKIPAVVDVVVDYKKPIPL
jgi:acetolactate synthase-1/2/3 large subunit